MMDRIMAFVVSLILTGCPGHGSEEAAMEAGLPSSAESELELERHLDTLWELWQADFDSRDGEVQLERAGFERRVRTVGSGEDVRELRRDVRAFFDQEQVRALSERVVALERDLQAGSGSGLSR